MWKEFNNDDVMGLTLEGIKETAIKAKHFSQIFTRKNPIVFIHTESVRSLQTASMLRSELMRKYGFNKVHMSKTTFFNELPTPSIEKPIPDEFDYEDFKRSPHYSVGGHESFFQRMTSLISRIQSDDLFSNEGHKFYNHDHVQFILVSHHYALCAFLGALISLNTESKGSNILAVAPNAQNYYIHHDEVYCVTHLMSMLPEPMVGFTYLKQNTDFHLAKISQAAGISYSPGAWVKERVTSNRV